MTDTHWHDAPGDKWDADRDRAHKLQVNPDDLEDMAQYLDILVQAVRNDLRPAVDQVQRLLTVGDNEGQSAFGSTDIPYVADAAKTGESGRGLDAKTRTAYQSVSTGLDQMCDELTKASGALHKIADKYKSADARNAATAADFQAGLGT
jgi:hypothetical protein